MKKTRSLLTLFLAVLMLAGMIAFGGISASAQDGASNLQWSGTYGYWDAPGTYSYFEVNLYAGGTKIGEYTVTEPMIYFGTEMSNYGAGDFTFGVRTVFDEGPAWVTEEVYSPYYHYDGGGGCSHANLISVSFHYPNCTEDGDKGHYECEDCGEWFWDSSAANVIDDHDDVINPKLGHDWGDWVIVIEPTTEKEGLAQRVCNRDSNHVESMTLSKLSDGEKVEDVKEKLPALAEKAEKASEVKTDATAATTAASTAAASASSATEAAKNAQRTKSDSDNSTLMIVLIIIGACLLIALIVVIVILILKKNKKEQ